jgi:hypothetical protein
MRTYAVLAIALTSFSCTSQKHTAKAPVESRLEVKTEIQTTITNTPATDIRISDRIVRNDNTIEPIERTVQGDGGVTATLKVSESGIIDVTLHVPPSKRIEQIFKADSTLSVEKIKLPKKIQNPELSVRELKKSKKSPWSKIKLLILIGSLIPLFRYLDKKYNIYEQIKSRISGK